MGETPGYRKQWKTWAADLVFDLTGGLLSALGTQVFSAPNRIAPGGVTGISILVNYLTGLPISMTVLALNLPLLILAWFFLGKGFSVKTVQSVLVMTLTLELVKLWGFTYQGDTILAALYGGVLGGVGVAMVFMRGSTTGGTDIVARFIQKRMRAVSVGKLLMGLDGLVLLCAAIVYRDIETVLFAMVSMFARTRMMDSILYGLDVGKVLIIVTQAYDAAAERIGREVSRGCTLLDGKGSYTRRERPVLLCAVRKNQVHEVKRIVFELDSGAFIMAMEANEVIGKGFRAY